MRTKLDRLNAGLDPDLIHAGIVRAEYRVEEGTRKFVDYAKAMVGDFGEMIKLYLKYLNNAVRD